MQALRIILISFCSLGQSASYDPNHSTWTKWLKQFATIRGPVTTVDYAQAKANPSLLELYLTSLEGVAKEQYDAFSKNEQLAFLINAYNAQTVKWIVTNYPTKSIKDTVGFLGNPWKKKFFKLLGEEQHLDGIEHDTIRKNFAEPRIHFAVVCASKGCPALRGEAFVGNKIEAQLEVNTRSFLSDTARNRYDAATNTLHLSKLFDWYGDDFKKQAGSVQAFVAPRFTNNPTEAERIKEAKINFLDYDWSLNTAEPSLAKH